MAVCKKCEVDKPEEGFYRVTGSVRGRDSTCKECRKSGVRLNRQRNLEYYREYDRKRGNRQGYEYHVRYRTERPEHYVAQYTVTNAVRDGRLEKPHTCERCGCGGRIHGHHEDYSKPLEVMWLCAACHKQRHKELGWGYIWNVGLDLAG